MTKKTKVKNVKKIPKNILDLKAAEYNPRTISPQAMEGLKESTDVFGDLSGIVFNSRTGQLVAGHQRVKVLQDGGAKLQGTPKTGLAVVLGKKEFPVRMVDWDEDKAKAGLVAANSHLLTGIFTDDLSDVLGELEDFDGFEALRLGELKDEFLLEDLSGGDEIPEDSPEYDESCAKDVEMITCPHCNMEFPK